MDFLRTNLFKIIILILILNKEIFAQDLKIQAKEEFTEKGKEYAIVLINDQIVFKLSSINRANIVADRIKKLHQKGLLLKEKLILGEYKKDVVIASGNYLVLVIIDEDVKLNKTRKVELGNIFLKNLKKALTPPTLIVSPEKLIVPINEVRKIKIFGTAKGKIEVDGFDTSLIELSIDENSNTIAIKGIYIGKTEMVIKRERIEIGVEIFIKKYAGWIPNNIEAKVTGDPCPSDILKDSVVSVIKQKVNLESGAQLIISKDQIRVPSCLPSGGKSIITAPFKIFGSEYLPLIGEAKILLNNEILPFQKPSFLIVSNSPENIKGPCLLQEGDIFINKPIRLLYHHKNISKKALNLGILLFNPSSSPVKIQIIKGISGPSREEIFVGHRATCAFLQNYLQDVGNIIEIPPESYSTILIQRIPPNLVVSGLINFRIVEGEQIKFQVKSENVWVSSLSFSKSRIDPIQAIYANPEIELIEEYNVGEKWKFINIGQDPLTSITSGEKLLGNYGVFYNINLTLYNPSYHRWKVFILFIPAGGPAGGTFLIDNKIKDVGIKNHNDEYKLKTITLEPKEVRTIFIKTMPQAGSCYPIRIVIHS